MGIKYEQCIHIDPVSRAIKQENIFKVTSPICFANSIPTYWCLRRSSMHGDVLEIRENIPARHISIYQKAIFWLHGPFYRTIRSKREFLQNANSNRTHRMLFMSQTVFQYHCRDISERSNCEESGHSRPCMAWGWPSYSAIADVQCHRDVWFKASG